MPRMPRSRHKFHRGGPFSFLPAVILRVSVSCRAFRFGGGARLVCVGIVPSGYRESWRFRRFPGIFDIFGFPAPVSLRPCSDVPASPRPPPCLPISWPFRTRTPASSRLPPVSHVPASPRPPLRPPDILASPHPHPGFSPPLPSPSAPAFRLPASPPPRLPKRLA